VITRETDLCDKEIAVFDLSVKRAYATASPEDGFRILVDRLWPRGMNKRDLKLDYWAKDIAPSTTIRKAFNHDPQRIDVFRLKYIDELEHNPRAAEFISLVSKKLNTGNITFIYGAKNETYNHAVILKDYLLERLTNINTCS
jgi:uncharacterized protein YeaO (DUF488 family)